MRSTQVFVWALVLAVGVSASPLLAGSGSSSQSSAQLTQNWTKKKAQLAIRSQGSQTNSPLLKAFNKLKQCRALKKANPRLSRSLNKVHKSLRSVPRKKTVTNQMVPKPGTVRNGKVIRKALPRIMEITRKARRLAGSKKK